MIALEHAPELRVSGRLDELLADADRQQRDWGHAIDRAAAPAALASAAPIAAIGASVLGAVVCGVALAPTLAPTTLAILMLLPLSAFEATTALPGAGVQLARSRLAARRLHIADERRQRSTRDDRASPRFTSNRERGWPSPGPAAPARRRC